MNIKSAKKDFFRKFKNRKTCCEVSRSEDSPTTFNLEPQKPIYSISTNEYREYFKSISEQDFWKLKQEFKELISESMILKEKKSSILTAVDALLDLEIEDKYQIFQVDFFKVIITRCSFSNKILDSVFIPKVENFGIIEYIVTQDPYIDSITDFLQMVWEHDIKLIIYIKKKQKQKMKINEYWLTQDQDIYFKNDDCIFIVSFKAECTSDNLTERYLYIKKNSEEKRLIVHLDFTTSSDDQPSLNAYDKVFNKITEMKILGNCYPILIHSSNINLDQCSMLICIDKIISHLKRGAQEINIFKTMLEINNYRNLMLQQEGLYLFIYKYIDWFLRRSLKATKVTVFQKRQKSLYLYSSENN